MFWIFAALVLLIIVSVTIKNRGPVRVIGCVLLAVILGWGLYQRLGQRPETSAATARGRSASPAAVSAPIPLQQIEISNIKLTGSGAPFELSGRITNHTADMHLTTTTLRTTRRDCYAGAMDPTGCVVIWQDQHWIRWRVPAGETREFVETLWAHTPVPRIRGTIKDEHELTGAAGTPAGK